MRSFYFSCTRRFTRSFVLIAFPSPFKIGLSPASTTYYTGFNYQFTNGSTFATSAQVTGELFAASMGSPTPSVLTSAPVIPSYFHSSFL